jgi:hypothetical protein
VLAGVGGAGRADVDWPDVDWVGLTGVGSGWVDLDCLEGALAVKENLPLTT